MEMFKAVSSRHVWEENLLALFHQDLMGSFSLLIVHLIGDA